VLRPVPTSFELTVHTFIKSFLPPPCRIHDYIWNVILQNLTSWLTMDLSLYPRSLLPHPSDICILLPIVDTPLIALVEFTQCFAPGI